MIIARSNKEDGVKVGHGGHVIIIRWLRHQPVHPRSKIHDNFRMHAAAYDMNGLRQVGEQPQTLPAAGAHALNRQNRDAGAQSRRRRGTKPEGPQCSI